MKRVMLSSISTVGRIALMNMMIVASIMIGCGRHDASDDATTSSRPVDEVAWVTDDVVDSVVEAMGRGERKGEVPIGAAVIVGTERGRLIFSGENSVTSVGDAAGHAEINAIQRAIRWAGSADAFKRIPTDSLYLVTSFEPCPMCAGAIASVWMFRPDHVALFLPKRAAWRDPELADVAALRAGYLTTGLDTLQLAAFCRVESFRKEYGGECK